MIAKKAPALSPKSANPTGRGGRVYSYAGAGWITRPGEFPLLNPLGGKTQLRFPKHPNITERNVTTIAEHQSVVIQHLLKEVADLQDRVMVLEAGFFDLAAGKLPEIIELREVSKEQAKAEIIELFEQTDGPWYYSDIEDRLRIDVELVMEICHELREEGVIVLDAYKAA